MFDTSVDRRSTAKLKTRRLGRWFPIIVTGGWPDNSRSRLLHENVYNASSA